MKKTLVLGASLKTERYSNRAINKLLNYSHPVVAIGVDEGKISGIKIETDLIDFKTIDTVTMYLNPTRQKQYYDYIISLNPRRVIFNPGTENPEFYTLLRDANIATEEACTLVLLTTNQY